MILSEKLDLDGTFDELLEKCYEVYSNDFITNKTIFKSLPVTTGRIKDGEKYPSTFWHIISGHEKEITNGRAIDYKRAKRIPWIKPIIENYNDPILLCWKSLEFDKSSGKEIMKYYFWYKEGNYIIVLKEIKTKTIKYFLATAFYVFERNVEHYKDLYEKGDKNI